MSIIDGFSRDLKQNHEVQFLIQGLHTSRSVTVVNNQFLADLNNIEAFDPFVKDEDFVQKLAEHIHNSPQVKTIYALISQEDFNRLKDDEKILKKIYQNNAQMIRSFQEVESSGVTREVFIRLFPVSNKSDSSHIHDQFVIFNNQLENDKLKVLDDFVYYFNEWFLGERKGNKKYVSLDDVRFFLLHVQRFNLNHLNRLKEYLSSLKERGYEFVHTIEEQELQDVFDRLTRVYRIYDDEIKRNLKKSTEKKPTPDELKLFKTTQTFLRERKIDTNAKFRDLLERSNLILSFDNLRQLNRFIFFLKDYDFELLSDDEYRHYRKAAEDVEAEEEAGYVSSEPDEEETFKKADTKNVDVYANNLKKDKKTFLQQDFKDWLVYAFGMDQIGSYEEHKVFVGLLQSSGYKNIRCLTKEEFRKQSSAYLMFCTMNKHNIIRTTINKRHSENAEDVYLQNKKQRLPDTHADQFKVLMGTLDFYEVSVLYSYIKAISGKENPQEFHNVMNIYAHLIQKGIHFLGMPNIDDYEISLVS